MTKWFAIIVCLNCDPSFLDKTATPNWKPPQIDTAVFDLDEPHGGEPTEVKCLSKAKALAESITFITAIFTAKERRFSVKCVERQVKEKP